MGHSSLYCLEGPHLGCFLSLGILNTLCYFRQCVHSMINNYI